MAVLKIYQVQNRVKSPEVPQTGSLALPLSLATNLGKGIGSIGKVLEDIHLTNKAEEDKNETADIVSDLNPKIAEIYNKYSKGYKVKEGVKAFNDELVNLQYNTDRKNVKRSVDKYLRDQRLDLGLSLSKQIINNTVGLSKMNNETTLNGYIQDITSKDAVRRSIGQNNYNNFFNNPSNLSFYGAENFKKLKTEKDKLLLSNILIKGIDNGNIDVSDPNTVAEIKKQFDNPKEVEKYLQRGRNKKISDVLKTEQSEIKTEKLKVETQLTNYASILNQIVQSKDDPTQQSLTIDNIYDVYNQDGLNTVQYNSIIKYFTNPNKLSDPDIKDLLNSQIAVASNAVAFDQIISDLNSDKSILDGLNPEDVILYKGVIDKYKNDKLGKSDFDRFENLLRKNIKDVKGVSFSIGNVNNVASIQLKADAAVDAYKEFIVQQNMKPEDAYLKALSSLTKDSLPDFDQLPQPVGFKLSDVKFVVGEDAQNGFDQLYQKAVDVFKNTNNINDYKTNIKNLDLIYDIYKVRKSFGENEKNFNVLGSLGTSKTSMNEG